MKLSLADLRCAICGSTEIVALDPGADPEYGLARDLLGDPDKRLPPILISAPVPAVARCLACMPKRREQVA